MSTQNPRTTLNNLEKQLVNTTDCVKRLNIEKRIKEIRSSIAQEKEEHVKRKYKSYVK